MPVATTLKTLEAQPLVRTKFLVLSDTHGMALAGKMPSQPVDVCIHCGDLTDESKLDEFRVTLELLHAIKSPLKLIIAGNHDFTLDAPSFRKKIEEANLQLEPELIAAEYGKYNEARQLLLDAKTSGIYLLDEGTHRFSLPNGARLTVYASPYTPSLGNWGFQYSPDQRHIFSIEKETDVVITHGPPRGILDRTNSRERAGCPDLFEAIAKATPRMHCFGHIHEGWGSKMVTWRKELSKMPSHFTDIDNSKSFERGRFDSSEDIRQKEEKISRYAEQKFCDASHCYGDETAPGAEKQTLFVNASIKGADGMPVQLPWLVELALPKADVRKRPDEPATVGRKRPLDADQVESERPFLKRLRAIGDARKGEV